MKLLLTPHRGRIGKSRQVQPFVVEPVSRSHADIIFAICRGIHKYVETKHIHISVTSQDSFGGLTGAEVFVNTSPHPVATLQIKETV